MLPLPTETAANVDFHVGDVTVEAAPVAVFKPTTPPEVLLPEPVRAAPVAVFKPTTPLSVVAFELSPKATPPATVTPVLWPSATAPGAVFASV